MNKRYFLVVIALGILGLALYPWLFMGPNVFRIPALLVVAPLFIIFSWVLWTGDFTPIKSIARKIRAKAQL